jgi:prolipoprotein diacylglyceryltransferase
MLPVLLDLKFVKIYTFGVFLVLAFFWSGFMLWKNIRLTQYKEEDIFDSVFISLAVGLFFGRLIHVILHFDKFGFDLFKFILINGYPGLSIYGFIFGAFGTLYIFLRSRKIKFTDSMNYFVTPAFIALGFGKLGSFFSGLEVGTKTRFPISVRYFGTEGLRHLTPLYEAILFFLGAVVSYKVLFEMRRDKYPAIFNLIFFFWYLGLVFFALDQIKEGKSLILSQSFNALISLILLLTFSFYFLYYFRSSINNLITRRGTDKKLYPGTAKKTRGRQD